MRNACFVISCCFTVLHVCDSFSLVNSFRPSRLKIYEGSFATKHVGKKWVLRSSPSKGDEERALTNEECDVLNLPYGTTLIGDMSDRYFFLVYWMLRSALCVFPEKQMC
jgi:hypothetical protein